jgi:hypothetical protein
VTWTLSGAAKVAYGIGHDQVQTLLWRLYDKGHLHKAGEHAMKEKTKRRIECTLARLNQKLSLVVIRCTSQRFIV